MTLIEVIQETYPPYALYQLIITFAILGTVKFTDFYQQDALKKFSTLPKWLWKITAIWELAIATLLMSNQIAVALYFVFIIMGGVIYAVTFIKDTSGKTQMKTTSGIAILPVRNFSF